MRTEWRELYDLAGRPRKELARRLKVSTRTISYWLSGERNPTGTHASRFARAITAFAYEKLIGARPFGVSPQAWGHARSGRMGENTAKAIARDVPPGLLARIEEAGGLPTRIIRDEREAREHAAEEGEVVEMDLFDFIDFYELHGPDHEINTPRGRMPISRFSRLFKISYTDILLVRVDSAGEWSIVDVVKGGRM